MHSIYFLTKIITYLTATIKAVGHMQREEVSKTQHFHGIGKKKKKVGGALPSMVKMISSVSFVSTDVK